MIVCYKHISESLIFVGWQDCVFFFGVAKSGWFIQSEG